MGEMTAGQGPSVQEFSLLFSNGIGNPVAASQVSHFLGRLVSQGLHILFPRRAKLALVRKPLLARLEDRDGTPDECRFVAGPDVTVVSLDR